MKAFYHQGKTGGSFIRKCIEDSNTNCLFINNTKDLYNVNLGDYEYCYIHSKDSPNIIKLLKSKLSNFDLYTCIRHPISSFISSVRHARRENNYSILPLDATLIHGPYTDLKFNNLNKKGSSTDGNCLNVHQYKIHGASLYLRFLLNHPGESPAFLERYTNNLSLGNKELLRYNRTICKDYLERKTPKIDLRLEAFQYIGLYELFQELLEKLSEVGFINSKLTIINELDKINKGEESDEDEITEDLAFKWLYRYPSDFYLWTYIYHNIMKEKNP